MKTAEDILFDTMTDGNFTYVSFPAFVENESSVDVFDIAIKAIEAYAALAVAEATKDCYPKEFLLWKDLCTITNKVSRIEVRYTLSDMYAPAKWMRLDELFDYWKNLKK